MIHSVANGTSQHFESLSDIELKEFEDFFQSSTTGNEHRFKNTTATTTTIIDNDNNNNNNTSNNYNAVEIAQQSAFSCDNCEDGNTDIQNETNGFPVQCYQQQQQQQQQMPSEDFGNQDHHLHNDSVASQNLYWYNASYPTQFNQGMPEN